MNAEVFILCMRIVRLQNGAYRNESANVTESVQFVICVFLPARTQVINLQKLCIC